MFIEYVWLTSLSSWAKGFDLTSSQPANAQMLQGDDNAQACEARAHIWLRDPLRSWSGRETTSGDFESLVEHF